MSLEINKEINKKFAKGVYICAFGVRIKEEFLGVWFRKT